MSACAQFDMRSVVPMSLASFGSQIHVSVAVNSSYSKPHGPGMTGKTRAFARMRMVSGVSGGKSLHPHTRSKLEKRLCIRHSLRHCGTGGTILNYISSILCLSVLFKDEMRHTRENSRKKIDEHNIGMDLGHQNPTAPPPDHVRRSCAAAT